MRLPVCIGVIFVLSMVGGVHNSQDNSDIAGDVNDLLEMVPFDQLAALFFEYLSTDAQVNKVLRYLTDERFKLNLVQFETSAAFHEAYDSLLPLGVDIYSWTNELNRLLDIATIRPVRRRRSPGDGVYSLVKDALTLLPIHDIKEAYNHKLDTNPAFERTMDRLLTVELRNHIYTLMSTEEFELTTRQLADLGVAVSDIVDLLEDLIVDFFDLDSKEEDDEEGDE
ncbi:uncharacterized protein LOC128992516 [Macrosteles quadrilineatus]|uniref:uncharacterized protein LOC128992516 n=1 Tax=Macrosteles quadrilineatus TaxID=74068 RepID=UPI0023E2DEC2|nr:uncharacterized protein LOC128992516 [Macrosteles quadrilineatus]